MRCRCACNTPSAHNCDTAHPLRNARERLTYGPRISGVGALPDKLSNSPSWRFNSAFSNGYAVTWYFRKLLITLRENKIGLMAMGYYERKISRSLRFGHRTSGLRGKTAPTAHNIATRKQTGGKDAQGVHTRKDSTHRAQHRNAQTNDQQGCAGGTYAERQHPPRTTSQRANKRPARMRRGYIRGKTAPTAHNIAMRKQTASKDAQGVHTRKDSTHHAQHRNAQTNGQQGCAGGTYAE